MADRILWRRGFLRLWVVMTCLWVAFVAWTAVDEVLGYTRYATQTQLRYTPAKDELKLVGDSATCASKRETRRTIDLSQFPFSQVKLQQLYLCERQGAAPWFPVQDPSSVLLELEQKIVDKDWATFTAIGRRLLYAVVLVPLGLFLVCCALAWALAGFSRREAP